MDCEACGEQTKSPGTRVTLKIEENVAGIILAVLALITFANVVVRYLTNFSFAFTEEFSIFLMVIMTLVGSSSLMAKGGHLNISFVVDRLPEKVRRPVQLSALGITTFCFFIMGLLSTRMAWDEYRYEVTSPGLGVPTWIYTIWLPILFFAITGRAVGKMIRMRRGEE
ncbi:MAG: TRAP transporter small permease [Desulfobacteraceae bacterium]|nr:TRAP transporter small permease [Desulfobacteraceae bacterium]